MKLYNISSYNEYRIRGLDILTGEVVVNLGCFNGPHLLVSTFIQ